MIVFMRLPQPTAACAVNNGRAWKLTWNRAARMQGVIVFVHRRHRGSSPNVSLAGFLAEWGRILKLSSQYFQNDMRFGRRWGILEHWRANHFDTVLW